MDGAFNSSAPWNRERSGAGKGHRPTGRLANGLAHIDLPILDELGYQLLSQTGAALLFDRFSKIYERTSVMITMNPEIAEWTNVFVDAKMTIAPLD